MHYNNSTEHAGFAAVITLPASCSGICKDTSQALLFTLTRQARKPVKA
ncbi:putative lipoprotein [Clostridioides difficile P28]|nr:putative lipoprotein [Clostridioides difficile P28]